jgi:hypothetical protein
VRNRVRVPGGPPLTGVSGIPMGPNDFISLFPTGVIDAEGDAYATAVNMRVAGSGRLNFRRSKRSKVAPRNQSLGFMALAVRVARTSPMFAGFNVSVGFTTRNALPGEVVGKAGKGSRRTAFIKITAKAGRFKR